MIDEHEKQANEAIAINAVTRRLNAVGRINWGILDVQAKHVIEGALSQIVNDQISPAYAEAANIEPPKQERSEAMAEAVAKLNEAA